MKTKMLMTGNSQPSEVEVEEMWTRPGEYTVYPYCITKSALEDLGFKFHNVMAEAA